MKQFGILVFLILVQGVHADERNVLVSNSSRGIIKEVSQRLCIAGQVEILKHNREKDFIEAKMIACFGSSELHPNSSRLGEKRIVDRRILGKFEVGKTYCMILTYGSMIGMTIVAYADDTPEAVKETRKIMQSEKAFQNSKEWQKRRALWGEFRKNRTSKEDILAYCENESLTAIFYYDGRYRFHQFSLVSKKEKTYYPQAVIGRPSRITFEDGKFTSWSDGEITGRFWEISE